MTPGDDKLLDGLTALGCGVKREEGAIFVSLPDDFAEFVFDFQGESLYLGTTFMTPEEFDASSHGPVLDRFLLELHDRSLGCHFAYDRQGFLTIGSELYRCQLDARGILELMDQVAFVIEICLPICDRILETGVAPTDAEIDEAFGANKKLH